MTRDSGGTERYGCILGRYDRIFPRYAGILLSFHFAIYLGRVGRETCVIIVLGITCEDNPSHIRSTYTYRKYRNESIVRYRRILGTDTAVSSQDTAVSFEARPSRVTAESARLRAVTALDRPSPTCPYLYLPYLPTN